MSSTWKGPCKLCAIFGYENIVNLILLIAPCILWTKNDQGGILKILRIYIAWAASWSPATRQVVPRLTWRHTGISQMYMFWEYAIKIHHRQLQALVMFQFPAVSHIFTIWWCLKYFTLIPIDAYGSGSPVSKKKMQYCLLIGLIYCADNNWEKVQYHLPCGQKSSDFKILGSVICRLSLTAYKYVFLRQSLCTITILDILSWGHISLKI